MSASLLEIEVRNGLFTCQRHAGDLRLSVDACAGMWRRGRTAKHPWDRLHACHACPTGAAHAGEAPRPEQPQVHECLRCGLRSNRLIRGQICVSCYNREREVITGRYRRGAPPKGLRIARVRVLVAGGESIEATTASTVEAILLAARQRPGQPVVAVTAGACPRWSARCTYPQASFLPGVSGRQRPRVPRQPPQSRVVPARAVDQVPLALVGGVIGAYRRDALVDSYLRSRP